MRKFLKRGEGDAAESRMDEYEYEYIEDDEEAGLEEQRRKRSADYLDWETEDHHLLEHYEPLVTAERRRRNSGQEGEQVEKVVKERSANWANTFKGVGGVFQKLGPSSFQSNYYSPHPTRAPAPMYTVTTTPAPSCSYVPRKTCTKVPRTKCQQVAKPVKQQVCLSVPVATPRQECRAVPRMVCDVVEDSRQQETCTVVPEPRRQLPPRCTSRVVETEREQCKDVTMEAFREVCEPVPRMVPTVECETRMKEIELKEICIDIDIQLPREECKQEEREECRFEPREVIVQRCEPTVRPLPPLIGLPTISTQVREECTPKAKTSCTDKCEAARTA